MSDEPEVFREIMVDVEPRNKEFRVAVMRDTKIDEVISTLIHRCEDEGIKVSDWGRSKVGNSAVSFVMMRKATGNTAIAPTVTFGELFPELEDRETFKLDARAQVGSSEPHPSIIEALSVHTKNERFFDNNGTEYSHSGLLQNALKADPKLNGFAYKWSHGARGVGYYLFDSI